MDIASYFIVAWIVHFIVHKIEGAKPSFLEDIKFLLIAPALLLSFIYQNWVLNYKECFNDQKEESYR